MKLTNSLQFKVTHLPPMVILFHATIASKVVQILDSTVTNCPLKQTLGVINPGNVIFSVASNDTEANLAKAAILSSKYAKKFKYMAIIKGEKPLVIMRYNIYQGKFAKQLHYFPGKPLRTIQEVNEVQDSYVSSESFRCFLTLTCLAIH